MDLIWNGFPIYVSGPFSSEDEAKRDSLKRLIVLYDQQDKEKEIGHNENWKEPVLLSEKKESGRLFQEWELWNGGTPYKITEKTNLD